jgi:glutaredoxin
MNLVELYSTEDCELCRDAKQLLIRLQKEFPFRIIEHVLDPNHPKFKDYVLSVPVITINGDHEISGVIEEHALRMAIKKGTKASRSILVFKFLEALGFVTVGTGLFYGVARNDEWQELYFMIAGIVVFAIGRILEKRELKKARM